MGNFVNNSEDKEENKQLSLFEVSQEFKEEKLDKKERVDNFCLYASERSRLKLEEILELW